MNNSLYPDSSVPGAQGPEKEFSESSLQDCTFPAYAQNKRKSEKKRGELWIVSLKPKETRMSKCGSILKKQLFIQSAEIGNC